ncbi:MAG: HU family DNA-binding protein [Legionella sp.]|jgi:nucleoid DNA-binding protein
MTVKKKATKAKTAAKKPVKKVVAKAVKKPAVKKAAVKKPAVKKVAAKAAKKPAVKKVATKAAKKPAVKKAVSAPAKKRAPAVDSVYTKTQLYTTIAECAGVAKKDVTAIFDVFHDIIEQHIKRRGPQVFTLPGLAKIKVINKPATKARKGINPFTGEPTVFKAKPARNVVKVLALKKLKDMAK